MADSTYAPPYAHVRALSRGLSLLTALNRTGSATPAQLSRATGLDRGTVYRLLETLCADGYVAPAPSSGYYQLTRRVRELSIGFTNRDGVSQIVAPELGQLLPKVSWPSDYAVFEGGAMIVRETTHPFSIFSVHRAVIGKPRPLLHSALGRAVLAAASPKLRQEMLAAVRATHQSDADDAGDSAYVNRLVADIRGRGYAWNIGSLGERMTAIALPVRHRGEPIGAINIIFFQSAMTPEEAADRYLADLRATVEAIERKLDDAIQPV